jgi:hypothetical protein
LLGWSIGQIANKDTFREVGKVAEWKHQKDNYKYIFTKHHHTQFNKTNAMNIKAQKEPNTIIGG